MIGTARCLCFPPQHSNPFRSKTRIAFDVATPARTRVTIHDVPGGLVRGVYDAGISPGRFESVWDGKRSDGTATRAGVSFSKLVCGDKLVAVGRLVRLE